jgi:hypothetical protein
MPLEVNSAILRASSERTSMKRLAIALLSLALAGCYTAYAPASGTANDELTRNIAQAKVDQEARIQAATEAAAAAQSAKLAARDKRVEDYIAGDGSSRPEGIKEAMKAMRVVHGMTHAEVRIMLLDPASSQLVASSEAKVTSTWEGVQALGPNLSAEKSLGHKPVPLTLTFTDGVVTEVTSPEL